MPAHFRFRPPPRRLALFTRQLATLVRAGLPLVRALETIARQERRGPIRAAALEIVREIEAGGTLSDGLARQPGLFDDIYIGLVRAGEGAGRLAEILDRLATFREKHARLQARLRTALLYPLVVGGAAAAIVTALVVFVVPRFEDIFATMLHGEPLPALTRTVLGVCRFVRHHFALLLIVGGAVAAAVARAARSRRGEGLVDWLVLQAPLLGDLTLKVAVARFARVFGALLAGGVPILEALAIGGATMGNRVLTDAINRVRERVEAGDALAGPLEAIGLFPPLMVGMVAVGEETGAVPEMLARVADAYEEEVDNAVTALTSVLEPLMVIVMALVVGTIVIALFLPIVRIIQALS